MRFPTIVGEACPFPGIGVFQTTFSVSLQATGGSCPGAATPSREGPRHQGQSDVSAAMTAEEAYEARMRADEKSVNANLNDKMGLLAGEAGERRARQDSSRRVGNKMTYQDSRPPAENVPAGLSPIALLVNEQAMQPTIREERPRDYSAIRRVNETAFGSPAEADLVEALRDGDYVIASLVAETERGVVGHLLFSRLEIETDDGSIPAASLAPMAVAPEVQRQGIGSRLVEAGLASCQERGERIAFVLGHPAFYPRFGFSSELASTIASPFGGGEAWMAIELVPGSLSGVTGRVIYPPPFAMFE